MKNLKRKICVGLAGAALALSLTTPAFAVTEVLSIQGRNIWQEAKTQMVGETTYASIRTMADYLLPEAEVSWKNGTAWVKGDGVTVSARPGDLYMKINDRVIYLPHGVRAVNGSVLVPVRAFAEALGSKVYNYGYDPRYATNTGEKAGFDYRSIKTGPKTVLS